MAFVPVTDTVMAEMRMTLFGQQIENTLYFNYPDLPTTGDLGVLGADLIDWWDVSYSVPLSSALQLAEVFLTVLNTSTSPALGFTPSSPTLGKDDSAASPGNVALAVSFRTINRGRSFRGRNFIPAIPSDVIAGNTIGSVTVAAIESAYEDLLTRHDTILEGRWCVVSRFELGSPRGHGVATPITGVRVVDPFVDSQRRRLTGRGL